MRQPEVTINCYKSLSLQAVNSYLCFYVISYLFFYIQFLYQKKNHCINQQDVILYLIWNIWNLSVCCKYEYFQLPCVDPIAFMYMFGFTTGKKQTRHSQQVKFVLNFIFVCAHTNRQKNCSALDVWCIAIGSIVVYFHSPWFKPSFTTTKRLVLHQTSWYGTL